MRIVGISGKARAGKDTIAQILAELYEGPTHVIPFAAAIKAQALELGWDGEKDKNGRALLRYIGLRERQDDAGHWVNQAFSVIYSLKEKEPDSLFVIPDVRFLNEAARIRAEKGLVWRVNRPDYDNGLDAVAKAHQSEVDLDNWRTFDAVLTNDGTVADLQRKVAGLMEMIR